MNDITYLQRAPRPCRRAPTGVLADVTNVIVAERTAAASDQVGKTKRTYDSTKRKRAADAAQQQPGKRKRAEAGAFQSMKMGMDSVVKDLYCQEWQKPACCTELECYKCANLNPTR
jgi:hypothetical protein